MVRLCAGLRTIISVPLWVSAKRSLKAKNDIKMLSLSAKRLTISCSRDSNTNTSLKMIEMLLTCDYDDYDAALDLERTLQRHYGFTVMLHVDNDCSNNNTKQDIDAKIEKTTKLLVFQLGESNISAWIIVTGLDEEDCTIYQDDVMLLPECIDFSESSSSGIQVLEDILYVDFGIDLKPHDVYAQPIIEKTDCIEQLLKSCY